MIEICGTICCPIRGDIELFELVCVSDFLVNRTMYRSTRNLTFGILTFTAHSLVGDLGGDLAGDLAGDLGGDPGGDLGGEFVGDLGGDLTGELLVQSDRIAGQP